MEWGKKQKPDPPPYWCAKGRPCDWDKLCAYCPHRECRVNITLYAEAYERVNKRL